MTIAQRTHAHQKRRSQAAKALHVAESILLHEADGHVRDLQQHYGIDPASPYGQLVQALLRAKRQEEAA
jgi:hypothetical protein